MFLFFYILLRAVFFVLLGDVFCFFLFFLSGRDICFFVEAAALLRQKPGRALKNTQKRDACTKTTQCVH